MRRKVGQRAGALAVAVLMLASQLLVFGAAPAAGCDRSLNAEVLAHVGGGGLGKVAVSGTVAYVCGTRDLLVLDVSDPSAPELLSQVPLPGQAEDVVVAGSFAYVVGDWGELQIVDVTDPAAPGLRGAIGWGGAMHSVAVVGNHAFVTSDGHGFKVVDVTDKDEPHLTNYVTPPANSYFYDIAVAGTKAYVSYGTSADAARRFKTIDISNPDAVRIVGTYRMDGTEGSIRSLAASGSIVFASEAVRGLEVVDAASTVTTPTKVGSFPIAAGSAFEVALAGKYAFLACGDQGLRVVDVSTPATPALAGQETGGLYHGIAVSAGRAYVTTGNEFKVLDVTDLAAIATLGSYRQVPAIAKDVCLANGYAYVAAGSEGLLKVEATTTAVPKIVGSATLSDATSVIVDGDTAYVLDGASLRVFDVSPDTPLLVGSKPLPAPAEGFCLDGDRLYVADGDAGLRLFDVTDRTSPIEVGSLVDPLGMGAFTYVEPPAARGPVHAVAASGEKVYIGIDGGNVVSLDASNPAAITEIARMGTYGDVLSLSLSGDRLYAGTSEKVYAIDASDPADIFQIGNYYYFGNRVLSVKGSGAYAFAATDSGFYLVDFSDAANPYVATDLGEGWMLTSGVDFDGDVAWVAANDEGLYGIKIPVLRTSGQSRYETAVELSKANWPSASYVVLATGANFADAACAAPLAHQLGGPLLLVHPRDGLTAEVQAEIQRLGADHVVIAGSSSAVATSTETTLEGLGVPAANIKRLAGVNRYDTARLIALDFKTALGSNPATAFVATGDRFPDALSVSGVAAVLDAPVLLLKRDTVPTETVEALTALGNPKLVAIGDGYSISDAVYAQLGCIARLAGVNRYETAAKVADYALANGFDSSEIIVTTGRTFPDALVSGVVSAKHGAPILLVSDELPDPTSGFIAEHQDEIRDITVVGSARSVSEGVEDAIVDALVW